MLKRKYTFCTLLCNIAQVNRTDQITKEFQGVSRGVPVCISQSRIFVYCICVANLYDILPIELIAVNKRRLVEHSIAFLKVTDFGYMT